MSECNVQLYILIFIHIIAQIWYVYILSDGDDDNDNNSNHSSGVLLLC